MQASVPELTDISKEPESIYRMYGPDARRRGTVAYTCLMARRLLERGVRLTGTDAWSWDAPFSYTAKKVAETGNKALLWEGHKAGRETGYCHLEKLHNLESLPDSGFTIACFPCKIRGASAGWTRAVAILDGS